MMLVELCHGVLSVDHRDDGVQQIAHADLIVHEESLRHRGRVGQASGLDDHAVELQGARFALLKQLAQNAYQIAAHRAADAAVVHLNDLLFAVLHQQLVVDTGFAELVFNHSYAVAVLFLQDAVEQRGFAAAEEAGEDGDGNLAHGVLQVDWGIMLMRIHYHNRRCEFCRRA